MKRGIVVAVLLLALALFVAAQSGTVLSVPVWNGARYVFAKLGPTLILNNGQLDAVVPVRHYDVLLAYDAAAGGWKLPAGAANVVVYVNGLRYRQGFDYSVASGVVKAAADNMLPEFQVTCDYDGQ